jgi:hypothetical protein
MPACRRPRLVRAALPLLIAFAFSMFLPGSATGQKPATISGQLSLTLDGHPITPAGAHVYLMRHRPSSFTYNDRTRDSVLAEWYGFWPAEFYFEEWSRLLRAPLNDSIVRRRDIEEEEAATEAGQLAEYDARLELRHCLDDAEATDSAFARTQRRAQEDKRPALVLEATTDAAGRFTIAGAAPGSFMLAARARVEDTEVYWVGDGEAKAGKALTLDLAKPLSACRAHGAPGPEGRP